MYIYTNEVNIYQTKHIRCQIELSREDSLDTPEALCRTPKPPFPGQSSHICARDGTEAPSFCIYKLQKRKMTHVDQLESEQSQLPAPSSTTAPSVHLSSGVDTQWLPKFSIEQFSLHCNCVQGLPNCGLLLYYVQ